MFNEKIGTNYASDMGDGVEKVDFARFVEITKETIKDYLPDEYENAIVDVYPCNRLNKSYLGMIVKTQKNAVSPTLNLNMFYDALQRFHYDLEKIMKKMAEVVQIRPMGVDMELFRDYGKAKEHLFIRVSNADKNQETLSNVPHTRVEDLAITYHISLGFEKNGISSAIVDNEMMRAFGVSKDELHQDAIENSPKLLPVKVEPLWRVMKNMVEELQAADVTEEDNDLLQDEAIPFTIVTNEQKINGASAIFYPGVMDQIGRLLKGNYFILPSSIHEMLILPDNGMITSSELKSWVVEANCCTVLPEEKLADEVYHYDYVEKIFEKASAFEARKRKARKRKF